MPRMLRVASMSAGSEASKPTTVSSSWRHRSVREGRVADGTAAAVGLTVPADQVENGWHAGLR